MRRVVILGRGGAGKSVAARRLSAASGLPLIELDALFWRRGPAGKPQPAAAQDWARTQRELVEREAWVIEGDLGPYDDLAPRLRRADAVIVLDYGLARCAWRAIRRGRENAEFWRWVILWRRRSRPAVLDAIARYAPCAAVRRVRRPRALDAALGQLGASGD